MKRLLLIAVALLSMAAQETKLPADHYCMAGKPDANQPRAHECHCKTMCGEDEEGNVTENESPDCKLYCKRDRCLCHSDEATCPKPS